MNIVFFPASSPVEKSCACTMTGRQKPLPSNHSNGTSIILHFISHSIPTIFSCIVQVGNHINHLIFLNRQIPIWRKNTLFPHTNRNKGNNNKKTRAHTHTQKNNITKLGGLFFQKLKLTKKNNRLPRPVYNKNSQKHYPQRERIHIPPNGKAKSSTQKYLEMGMIC